jgi:UDP-N-acetylglucosamine acyltransferase
MKEYRSVNGNLIHSTAVIAGNVKLGKGNIIMPYAVIGETGFIRNASDAEGIVEIGDDNKIGCHVSIMAGLKGVTKIGSSNLIMNFVNIGHDCIIGYGNEIGAKCIVAGWSKIGNECKIKVGAMIRNRKSIGDRTVVGMGAIVVKDLPANVVAYGNPAKIQIKSGSNGPKCAKCNSLLKPLNSVGSKLYCLKDSCENFLKNSLE